MKSSSAKGVREGKILLQRAVIPTMTLKKIPAPEKRTQLAHT
jgi:hypothetical protein